YTGKSAANAGVAKSAIAIADTNLAVMTEPQGGDFATIAVPLRSRQCRKTTPNKIVILRAREDIDRTGICGDLVPLLRPLQDRPDLIHEETPHVVRSRPQESRRHSD